VRTERSYVGFDTDMDYIALAEERIAAERARPGGPSRRVVVPAKRAHKSETPLPTRRQALTDGRKATDVARLVLQECGFSEIEENVTFADVGLDVTFRARDKRGGVWLFELSGALSVTRPGLKRADNVWRALGKATIVATALRQTPARRDIGPLVLLSVDLPTAASAAERALRQAVGPGNDPLVEDIIDLFNEDALARLAALASRAASAR